MTASVAVLEHRRLLAAARDPADDATLAFAGVLSRFRMHGIDWPELSRLLGHYFPGVEHAAGVGAVCNALDAAELEDLFSLLREHRRDDSEETEWLARAIVSACAGNDHLWQDMGLPNRETLSRLIRRHFPTLYYRNAANLKWKKFFYKQLCDRAEAKLCKAPSCSVCADYAQCFGGD